MLSTRMSNLACAVDPVVCVLETAVSAQPGDNRIVFTFSGPVTLPGATLSIGQYRFTPSRSAQPARPPLPRTAGQLPLITIVGTGAL